jgi:hypothetical protein
MGARIRVQAGGLSQIREIAGGGSYLSQSDLRANFGLAKAALAETVEIKWPNGQQQVFHNVEADRFYLIEEGRDRLDLQKFGHPAALTDASKGSKAPPADAKAKTSKESQPH